MSVAPRRASGLPSDGVANQVLRDLVPPLRAHLPSRIVVVSCGVRIHFPWAKACAAHRSAAQEISSTLAPQHFTVISAPEPFEDPAVMLRFLQAELEQGIDGLILFHAAYTCGEIGAHLGRWLHDHPVPLLSWSVPDQPAERLEANSLCCQNFLLGMLHRMGVRYAWQHEPHGPTSREFALQFARTCRAKAILRQTRVLHIGGSRVTAFYDGETDELAAMRRFGVQFDRIDLGKAFDVAKAIDAASLCKLRDAIVQNHLCAFCDVPDEQMLQTLRLALAALTIAHEHGYSACTIKSWPELFELYHCAADGAVAILNDYGLCTAEEGDMNGVLSSLALHALSEGSAVPTMMDLSGINPEANRLCIWHCGASATRWLRSGSTYHVRKHSILENADPSTAVGMMLEFLLELGPATVHRYQSPDAAQSFCFDGTLVDAEAPFRGAYCEMVPALATAQQIVGTILQRGLDHHWSVGSGHWASDLRMLNHWLDIKNIDCSHTIGSSGLSV